MMFVKRSFSGQHPKEKNILIGCRICAARNSAGYTQKQLAQAIDVSPQYISDLERGISDASIITIIRICQFLQVSSDYILMGYKNPARKNITIQCYEYLEPKNQEFSSRMTHLFLKSLIHWGMRST